MRDEMPDDSGPDRVALSFVDLLYAVPVAALATRVAETQLKGVSASGWADIALALVPLTLGWIGHHNNRLQRQTLAPERSTPQRPFTELRFLQFGAEVLIIGVYFALSTRLVLPGNAGVEAPDLPWKASWLLALFALYVGWDVLDISIAATRHHDSWRKRACFGAVVSLAFVAVFGVVRFFTPAHAHSTVSFDLICIVLLYVYRVIQQWVINKWGGGPQPVQDEGDAPAQRTQAAATLATEVASAAPSGASARSSG